MLGIFVPFDRSFRFSFRFRKYFILLMQILTKVLSKYFDFFQFTVGEECQKNSRVAFFGFWEVGEVLIQNEVSLTLAYAY